MNPPEYENMSPVAQAIFLEQLMRLARDNCIMQPLSHWEYEQIGRRPYLPDKDSSGNS